ncbi:hypothetical protein M011DRAFT_88262 [Sporormia fimetaria CBS 119925]|uniref:BTB domain-containing protein n=1 Tax=Sporormia fimetaria CBS 119925 TaxID=1340428 RepID=A0A6A6V681_9PLEO|nr:hypothetical protein M011DRAFT_88262 [Sporormia fimetaria CBS 119925]
MLIPSTMFLCTSILICPPSADPDLPSHMCRRQAQKFQPGESSLSPPLFSIARLEIHQVALFRRRHATYTFTTIAFHSTPPFSSVFKESQEMPKHRRASADDAQTLTVKLRNIYLQPPVTQTFHIPLARAISTSKYLRDRHSTPPRRSRDGIIRLNFPDFEIFGIYAAWLHSGIVSSRLELHELKNASQATSHAKPSNQAKAPASSYNPYTDFLGAYFLATWLKDTVFKDSLVSHIISRVNTRDEGPRFLQALSPSIVDLVLTEKRTSMGLRKLMYAGILRWGTGEHLERFVPDEGRTMERGFVRGLMGVMLLRAQRGGGKYGQKENVECVGETGWRSEIEGMGDGMHADAWTLVPSKRRDVDELRLGRGPKPFGVGRMEDLWRMGEGGEWETSEEGDEDKDVALQRKDKDSVRDAEWPRGEGDYCLFHEHRHLGLACTR